MPTSVIKAAELFEGISSADSELVFRLCAEKRYPQGMEIFSRGDPSEFLYVLREGLVRLCSVSEKGKEMTLHILKPDAVFGELLLSEESRALTAVAKTDVAVTAISRSNLEILLSSVPTISRNLIRILSRRLAKVEMGFADFGHTWSYHRLAIVLLQLADEHGVKTTGGVRITHPLTHEDLAKRIGATRETVTTQVNRFRRLGMLKREGRHYLVNRQKLAAFLGAE